MSLEKNKIDFYDWKNEKCRYSCKKSGWCSSPKSVKCKNHIIVNKKDKACEIEL